MSELRFRANPKQKEALRLLDDHIHDSVGYGGGGGGGKSYLGVFWNWSQCIMYDGVRYFFGRDELKNVKKTTLVTYYKFLREYEIDQSQHGRFIDDESRIVFPNESEILLLDLKYHPSDPLVTKLGSLELTGGFVDESPEVDIRVLDILYTRIGRCHNDTYDIHPTILEGFNPSKDHVYHRFYKPWKEGTLPPNVAFVRATALDWLKHRQYFIDNLQVHPEEANTWYGRYITQLLGRSEVTKQRLLWGNFEYDDDPNALIDYEAMQDLFTNSHVPRTGVMSITADIALEGSDRFVVYVWDGWVIVHREIFEKTKPDEVVRIIERIKTQWSVPNSRIVYDSDGVGAYVGGWVKNAKAFVNNSSAREVKGERGEMVKENYDNLKAQCSYRIAKRINERTMYAAAMTDHDRPVLIEELEQIKSPAIETEKRLKIIPKAVIKATIGRSPDMSDALIMRELLELEPPVPKRGKLRVARV